MAVTIGQQLGSLEVTELIGRGGMGEVYRARDTKLKRNLAIKILPHSLLGSSKSFANVRKQECEGYLRKRQDCQWARAC